MRKKDFDEGETEGEKRSNEWNVVSIIL